MEVIKRPDFTTKTRPEGPLTIHATVTSEIQFKDLLRGMSEHDLWEIINLTNKELEVRGSLKK